MAEKYGYTNFLLKQRIDVAEGKKPRPKPVVQKAVKNNNWLLWPGAFLTVMIILLAIFSLRKKTG